MNNSMDLDKKLKQEKTKETLKEVGKVAGALIIGVGVGYACDKLGVTSWSWKTRTGLSTLIFGEGFSNFIYNYGARYIADTAIAAVGAAAAYVGLDHIIDK